MTYQQKTATIHKLNHQLRNPFLSKQEYQQLILQRETIHHSMKK